MKFRFYILIFTATMVFYIPNASGGTTIEVDVARSFTLIPNSQMEIFRDSNGIFNFSDIQKQKFNLFENINSLIPANEGIVWIRFKLKLPKKTTDSWILEIMDSRQNKLEFFQPVDSIYKQTFTGIDFFSNREIIHKNYTFRIDPSANYARYFYFKIVNKTTASFLLKISKTQDFIAYSINEYYLLGLYYGFLLMMLVYSLFIFFSLREKVHVYYGLYIMCWIFYSLKKDGTGFQYLWPNNNSIIFYNWPECLLLGSFILYSYEFLRIGIALPMIRKILLANFLLVIVISFIEPSSFSNILAKLIFLVPFLIIYISSIVILRKGFKPAKFFLLSHSFILLSLAVTLIRDNYDLAGIIKYDFICIVLVYMTNISMVIEITILSFTMAELVKFLKQKEEQTQLNLVEQLKENQKYLEQNQQLAEKVNKELDEKVKDRTIELEQHKVQLEQLNNKLLEQSAIITHMNSKLDLDNYDLKKKLVEEKHSRMLHKDFSYEDFLQLYPTEISCFKYIEDLKQQESYECMRCGNHTYGKGINIFSRKCLRCRYDETILTKTIFYRSKFSIQKALYILIVTNLHGEHLNISELSKKLNLRKATCWTFVKKIQEIQQSKKYRLLLEEERFSYLILYKRKMAKGFFRNID